VARLQSISADLNARYRLLPGRNLVVTEASSTGVVESFTLLTPNIQATRTVDAANGVWFAICPARAMCPYPAVRDGLSAAAILPRRLALELALRTFRETSASVVAVSLPTPRSFTILILERSQLAQDANLASLARAVERATTHTLASVPRRVIDRVTRPHVFVFLALEPTSGGRETFAAIPRWPDLGAEG
jgi:hypothetical protein